MKALATFLGIWGPIALVGWLALAHLDGVRVLVGDVLRALGGF